MIKPRNSPGEDLHLVAPDSAFTESTRREPDVEQAAPSTHLPGLQASPRADSQEDQNLSRDDRGKGGSPLVKTSVPAQSWASSLASRQSFHELAKIYRPNSYHARTDTAAEKRRLATEIFLAEGGRAVQALLDMLVDRGVANREIAELLIQIDDPRAAAPLRQLWETGKFAADPRGMSAFIARHLRD